MATSRIRYLTMLHAKISSELGRPPKDEGEFKEAIGKSDVDLKALKVESLDELFVSERDGQPMVVAYGPSPFGVDVVAYEQTGVNGMRQVGHKIGMVEEVDEARFRELVPASGVAKAAK
ncbi:MAG: hypothetical protein H0T51_22620 [Pirellulales bacterium]|nr:hypothetical protein [Pirellulales bacterium]